mmetsp:Transcript_13064/g.48505  ORF Transcript_13064/g.48505 Transcript_13064/m.48505 type:complete len:231 (-) Transcript_13064:621-1313(-)
MCVRYETSFAWNRSSSRATFPSRKRYTWSPSASRRCCGHCRNRNVVCSSLRAFDSSARSSTLRSTSDNSASCSNCIGARSTRGSTPTSSRAPCECPSRPRSSCIGAVGKKQGCAMTSTFRNVGIFRLTKSSRALLASSASSATARALLKIARTLGSVQISSSSQPMKVPAPSMHRVTKLELPPELMLSTAASSRKCSIRTMTPGALSPPFPLNASLTIVHLCTSSSDLST